MVIKSHLTKALGLLILLALMGWQGSAVALEPVRIQLKWLHQFQFAGYYAAIEKGFYAQEGLDVRLIERQPNESTLDSVLAGAAEYGTSNIGLLLARQNGRPVVLLAQVFQHSPLALLTLRESGIQTPFDLRGKRVMFETDNAEDAPLLALLHSTLGSVDQVVEVDPSFDPSSLLRGEADAMAVYLSNQPLWFQQRNIPTKIIDPRDYSIDHYGDNLFTTESEIAQHPGRADRVRRATLKGWRYALEHPEEIIDLILAKYDSQQLGREILEYQARHIRRMILPEHIELGHYEPARFEKIARAYARMGLTRLTEVDPGLFYSNHQPGLRLSDEEQAYLASLPPLKIPLRDTQPPISYLEDGQPQGYATELVQQLAKMLGLRVEWVSGLNFEQALAAIKSGEVDLLHDYSHIEERDYILPTRPILSLPFVAVGRADAPIITRLEQLAGKRLVLVRGFRQTHSIQQLHPEWNLLLVQNIESAYSALRSGQADYYIDHAAHAGYYLRSNLISDLKIAGSIPSSQLHTLQFSLAVSTRHEPLRDLLNRALDSLSREELINLRSKWALGDNLQLALTPEERAWLAAHPVIRLASDTNWLPFEAIDEQGQHQGVAADFMKLIEQRLGVRFQTSPRRPWHEIADMLKRRELDLFSCAMATEPRRVYAQFTQPYISSPIVIVTREETGYIDGLEGLQGRSLAVVQGYASHDMLKVHPQLQLQTYPDIHSGLMAVMKGQAFAYADNIAAISTALRNQAITNLKISGQLPYRYDLALGVRSDWPELVPILQKALDSISEAERQAILQRWVKIETREGVDRNLIFRVLLGISLVILLILYWNHTLRSKVRQRTAELERELGERQHAEEQILHQAHYDALTDLPNRFLALDRLGQMLSEAERDQLKVAVLYLDLDDFKKINDSLGHNLGDEVLIDTATRLRHAVRGGDTVGRLGGDEFIVLLSRITDANHVSSATETLLDSLRDSFLLANREFMLTTSVGIALFPQDGKTPLELLRNAETAMYHAKNEGHSNYSYFTEEMNRGVARRVQVEEQMHGALPRQEFQVYYQTQIDIASRQIVGFEALLRWHNPVLGQVFPDEFIPIAEHTGLILSIGEFVLHQALCDLGRWQAACDRPLSMAINLSPRQFRDPLLHDKIQSAIEAAAIAPAQVELEITEGVLLSGHDQIRQTLHALDQYGVRIAMDDFGTGYSSLSYLRRYPFHTLKIDREFIIDMTEDKADRELVNATIAMAQALGLKVVAEGVETEQHLALLAEQGCDFAQGYLFGRPVPAEQIRL